MKRRKQLLIVLGICGLAWLLLLQRPQAQVKGAAAQENTCVACHSSLQAPLALSARYYDWESSRHQAKGVTCDKCHGGDPTTSDLIKTHLGVRRAEDRQSRLHYRNLPETCGACHQNIVSTFVQSKHYQGIKGVGLGASCNACHAHMATHVIYSPDGIANLCARCHDTLNFVAPRPEIPVKAAESMMALQRANAVVLWANLLLAQGQQRGLTLDAERDELRAVQAKLGVAKVNWHTFELAPVRQQADEAFQQGAKVKDALRKKLNFR